MKAVVVERFGDVSKVLGIQTVPEPELEPKSVLVDVRAVGCNFFDVLMVAGKYQFKPSLPFTPGSEFSGVVSKLGPGAKGFQVGDRVFGSVPFGAYAEKVAAPTALLYKMPDSMTFEDTAGFPITYPNAYASLVLRANVKPGETVLVHGAAGGVGVASVQVAKALGARVIATASDEAKLAVAKQAGADEVVNYTQKGWPQQVKKLTKNKGVDVVIDPVGGDVFDDSTRCIAWNGRIVVVGFASGRIPSIAANRLLLKNISVLGVFWGAYIINEYRQIRPTLDALARMYTYPLEDLSNKSRLIRHIEPLWMRNHECRHRKEVAGVATREIPTPIIHR